MFSVIKKALGGCHAGSRDYSYFPKWYFRRQIMAWMIKHRQLILQNKYIAMMSNCGIEEETSQFKGPLSYKQYLHHLLQRDFWGDEIVLYAISCMWHLKITVVNSQTLQE